MIQRKCVVTSKIFPTDQLIKFVLTKDGKIHLETNQKIYGRGAYCYNDPQIIEILFKKRLLNKSFRTNIPISVYESLEKEVENFYGKK